MDNNNYIITGPPRSGTTLTCHLLNDQNNTVALHEPMSMLMFKNQEIGLHNIDLFFESMRYSIINHKIALSKISESNIPDNPYADVFTNNKRESIVKKRFFYISKPISETFNLFIKHNVHFTFMLKKIASKYKTIVIIRNPLSTINSWNTINAPVAEGNAKVLKYINPNLYQNINNIKNLFEKQARLLDEMFLIYNAIPGLNIIKYEDIIESNGTIFTKILNLDFQSTRILASKNNNELYDTSNNNQIIDALKRTSCAWQTYYKL